MSLIKSSDMLNALANLVATWYPYKKEKKCFIDNIRSLLSFYKDPHRADMALQIIMITFTKSVNQNSIKPCQK